MAMIGRPALPTLCAFGFAAWVLASTPAVHAQGTGGTTAQTASPQLRAEEHFRTAREHYSAGRYRAAIEELEVAHKLDPQGTELVYNLGLIHEKLGDIEPAIRYYRRYRGMIAEGEERDRIDKIIQRLEGARKEVAPVVSPPPKEPPPAEQPHGRFDGWVIGTGAVAGAALVAGTVFGIKALADQPASAETRPGTSYQELRDQADGAHTAAIVADVSFGVALVAGASAALLYFGRRQEAEASAAGRMMPAVMLVPGGAAARFEVGF